MEDSPNIMVDHDVLNTWIYLLKDYAINHYTYDEQKSMATVVQTLQTMTASNDSSSNGSGTRIHVMCYIMVGSGRSHTLTAAQVIEPSLHEQLTSLRSTPSSSSSSPSAVDSTWKLDVSFPNTGGSGHVSSPLKGIHTIPLSLYTGTNDDNTDTTTKRPPLVCERTLSQVHSILTKLSPKPLNDEQLIILCIEFARMWSELPPSPETDSLIAHGLLAALAGTEELRGQGDSVRGDDRGGNRGNMTSAALAALLPIALQLLDRYTLSDQCLGLVVLWELLVQRSTSSLLAAVGPWLLPTLHKVFLAVPASFASADMTASSVDSYSTNAVIVVASRILQAVVITNQSSPIGTHHAHLLLQRVLYKVSMTLDPVTAWPSLLALQPFVVHCPPAVLCCHLQSTVDTLLSLINRWHVPLQVTCFQLLRLLIDRCRSAPTCLQSVLPKVVVELFRVELFLQSGSSDITGVTVEDPSGRVVGALRVEMRALSAVFRRQYARVWEATLKDVGMGGGASGQDDTSCHATKADEEWMKKLDKVVEQLCPPATEEKKH